MTDQDFDSFIKTLYQLLLGSKQVGKNPVISHILLYDCIFKNCETLDMSLSLVFCSVKLRALNRVKVPKCVEKMI